MRIVLFAISAIAFVLTVKTFTVATETESAIHEIEALLLLLVAALFFVGAAIVDAIVSTAKQPEPPAVISSTTAETSNTTAIQKQIVGEIESGSIDMHLWNQAKQSVDSDDEKLIRPEYMKLRIRALEAKAKGWDSGFPVK